MCYFALLHLNLSPEELEVKKCFDSGVGLTSAGDEHGVILCLHILLGALSRQSHTALAGMELTVDLSTGPCKHLTKGKRQ